MALVGQIREPSIEALRQAPVKFRYGSNKQMIFVDALSASAILAVYDSVGDGTKAKLARMVAGKPEQLVRVLGIAIRSCRL